MEINKEIFINIILKVFIYIYIYIYGGGACEGGQMYLMFLRSKPDRKSVV